MQYLDLKGAKHSSKMESFSRLKNERKVYYFDYRHGWLKARVLEVSSALGSNGQMTEYVKIEVRTDEKRLPRVLRKIQSIINITGIYRQASFEYPFP